MGIVRLSRSFMRLLPTKVAMFAGTALRLLVLHGILAHHGGTGRYDSGHPLYLRGRIIQARYAFPHGTMRIEVPANLTVPRDLPDVRRLGGYENWTGHPAPEGAGQVRDLLLPPDVTGTLADMSASSP